MARKTLEGHTVATNNINQFVQEHNFPELDQLTEKHVEGKFFFNLFENVEIWFSSTHFRTNNNAWIGNSSEEEKFKIIKEAFKHQLPTHELFAPSQNGWFAELKSRFKKFCKH